MDPGFFRNPCLAMVRADEEDIVGRDIDDGAQKRPKTSGKPVPTAPRAAKVEEFSEDEDDDDEDDEEEEEDDDEVTTISATQPSQPRNEVDPKLDFRQNAVHVYGLDFLKTGHMEEIFSQFNHKFIEWINDSCANVVFKNAEGAKTALESLSFPKKDDEPWRRTPDILVSEDVPPIFLQMRLASAKDAKRARKSASCGMPFVHYPPPVSQPPFGRGRGGRGGRGNRGGRRRIYADDDNKPVPAAAAKSKPEAGTKRPSGITDEEWRKRQKRDQRFGEAEEPEVVADDNAPQKDTDPKESSSKAAAESEPVEKQRSSEKDSDAPAPPEEQAAAKATEEPAPAEEKTVTEVTGEPTAEVPGPDDQKS